MAIGIINSPGIKKQLLSILNKEIILGKIKLNIHKSGNFSLMFKGCLDLSDRQISIVSYIQKETKLTKVHIIL